MLQIALFRHAKSSWDDALLDDFDRPLNERGRAAAPFMGKVLAGLGFAPDVVLCSSARRTRETLDYILPAFGRAPKAVVFLDALYLASAADILRQIKAAGPGAALMVVGHNPGLHMLACRLACHGRAEDISRLGEKFPTAAIALYSFPQTSFDQLDPETGQLEAFLSPKHASLPDLKAGPAAKKA